jgi:ParB-like chromosome segregation protein Spo0J
MSNVESTAAPRPTPTPPELPPSPENLPIHPLADEWPMGDSHEQASMAASIRDQGIHQPLTIWFFEGKWWLLDGRNRIVTGKSVNYRFKPINFKVFVGDLAAAVAYVAAVNGHRRHMTPDQKEKRAQALIAKYPNLAARKLALIVGVSHTTILKLRKPKEEDTTLKALMRAWETRPSMRKSSSFKRSRST